MHLPSIVKRFDSNQKVSFQLWSKSSTKKNCQISGNIYFYYVIFLNRFQLFGVFLPVEHRSYNRVFKISSAILKPHPTPEIIWKFFVRLVLPTKRPFNFTWVKTFIVQCLSFNIQSVSRGFYRCLAARSAASFICSALAPKVLCTHPPSVLSVCLLDPLPTLQNNEPVPQVLKQVVNLSCLS